MSARTQPITPTATGLWAVFLSLLLAVVLWRAVPEAGSLPDGTPAHLVGLLLLTLLVAVLGVRQVAALDGKPWHATATAALFGLWLLYFWQVGVTLFDVPRVLLPAPSWIGQMLIDRWDTLAGDFVQTVGKAVLVGWALGSGLGFAVGVAIDRAPFLQRGLLPLASLTSTVPLVAVAPIMVMWFGFEWPSKAAVVVLMTFFPMLVATLALIGAIVAEFFGSPTVGLGFRISTEAARMNMGLVWSAIVVAAVTGSVAYALLVQLERRVAFWHPSVRSK